MRVPLKPAKYNDQGRVGRRGDQMTFTVMDVERLCSAKRGCRMCSGRQAR